MHRAIKLVSPRGVTEEPLYTELNFLRGLFFADGSGEAIGNLSSPL